MNRNKRTFARWVRHPVAVIALLLGTTAQAGYLITDATITDVYNTASNQTSFAVAVQGGSGPCSGSANIVFPLSAAPDADTLKRAYAAALMAFALGLHVSIHNYSSDACTGASYIRVSQ
jgi:Family of unknown function (DUF5992)